MLLTYSTAVLCAVFIITGAVSGGDEKKAVGETVSFRPAKLGSSITSFTWKQINGVMVVKVIEWDVDDGFSIPNPRFQDITTLDKETGLITITNLKVEHSGLYSIDINSKEQEQRFSLTVMERVPKPVITIEKRNNTFSYLRCEYNETIIWKNSAGDTLKGTKNHNPGEFITVTNTRNPGNFYTCTLKNAVSEETSDRVSERDLFIEPVPKPNITIETSNNPDDVYLRCGYSETIIWKNSAGDTLKGTKNHKPGEFITVTNTRNPDNFYTCTLKNAVSEETSEPVYEKDIFGTESNAGLIAGIVIVLLLLIAIILIYLLVKSVHERVNTICSCIPNLFGPLDCLLKKEGEPKESQPNSAASKPLNETTPPSDEEPQ